MSVALPVAVAESNVTEHQRSLARRVPISIWACLIIIALFVAFAALPGVFAKQDPLAQNLLLTLKAPSGEHWFGTDQLGRDVFSRVIWGTRFSVFIGLSATVVSVVLGSLLGLAAGLSRGVLGEFLARSFDVLGAFPEVLLALFIIAFTAPGIPSLIGALGVAGIPSYARLTRAGTLVALESDFVEHARTFGISPLKRTLRHVLPHAVSAIPIFATIGLGGAVLAAAGLSFLGLGPQPPDPEWGAMLNEGRKFLPQAWWIAVFPGSFAVVLVIAVTSVGRWLQRNSERNR